MQKQFNQDPDILVINKRGNLPENIFHGWICAVDSNKKVIYKKGNLNNNAFLRSCTKPIQAIQTLDSNINFNLKELAIICSSHTGTKTHQKILNQIVNKYNINLKLLKCGTHMPFDEKEKIYLLKKGQKSNVLHNNCSGKHLGMLCICKKYNYDTEDYLNPRHPLQIKIIEGIKELSESKNIHIAIDGCGLPTFSLPLLNISYLFSNFTSNKSYQRIIEAMTTFPFLAGGSGQVDSELMNLSKNNLIVKVGADGIIIAAINGKSIVVKIADGNPKIRAFVLLRTLVKLRWIKESVLLNSSLKNLYLGEIKNISGKAVGAIQLINS